MTTGNINSYYERRIDGLKQENINKLRIMVDMEKQNDALEQQNRELRAALEEAGEMIDSLAHSVQFDGVKVARLEGKIANILALGKEE